MAKYKTLGTECSNCLAAMPMLAQVYGNMLQGTNNTMTGYRCPECGQWNDLEKRGKLKTE